MNFLPQMLAVLLWKYLKAELQDKQSGRGPGRDRENIRVEQVHAADSAGLRHNQPSLPAGQDVSGSHHYVPQNIQPESSPETHQIKGKGQLQIINKSLYWNSQLIFSQEI